MVQIPLELALKLSPPGGRSTSGALLQVVLVHLESGLQVSPVLILNQHADTMLEEPASNKLVLSIHERSPIRPRELTLIDKGIQKVSVLNEVGAKDVTAARHARRFPRRAIR